MNPPPVVPDLDVLKDRRLGFAPRSESLAVDELHFQRVKEALGISIVVAVTPPGHAGRDAVVLELLSVRLGCVLASPVRVTDEGFSRIQALPSHRRTERLEYGFSTQVIRHRVAHDFTSEHVELDCEIKPALIGGHIRDIACPHLVRTCGKSLRLFVR